jgi:hypothetical protein
LLSCVDPSVTYRPWHKLALFGQPWSDFFEQVWRRNCDEKGSSLSPLLGMVGDARMPAEPVSNLKFEIGHVLFIDIIGYSKLLITEQSELLRKLTEVVRETAQFRVADAEGKLLRLPTGDGMALVFRNSPEAPVQCALELSKKLKAHPELSVRMGIHSGPVNEVADVNERRNSGIFLCSCRVG